MYVEEECSADEFLTEAIKYHKTAVNGWRKRRAVFNADICYNLLGICIEKYFMSFLFSNNDIADNHTFSDLIDSYQRIRPFPNGLALRLKKLELLQNLCPLADAFSAQGLKDEDIEEMIAVTELVRDELGYSNDI